MSADTGYATLKTVMEAHEPDTGWVWAAEFGVYSGQSLAMIAKHMPVIGFDSFDGLPEDWRPGFKKGKFAVKGRDHQLPHTLNAMLIRGLFEDTAHSFPFPELDLVHIDCDLYSSTVTALESVVRYINPGTVIVFDEFHGYPGHEDHETKAWVEFVSRYGVSYVTLAEGPEEIAFKIIGIGGV